MSENNCSVEELDAFYDLLQEEVEKIGAKILRASEIYTSKDKFSEFELDSVRRNFLVDFGEYGFHLPDFDRVIYDAEDYEVRVVIFSSQDIAWGIAESAYWKMKYRQVGLTEHIKVYFVASGENSFIDDEVKLSAVQNFRRELDGCYTLRENSLRRIETKLLNALLDDVKNLEEYIEKVML